MHWKGTTIWGEFTRRSVLPPYRHLLHQNWMREQHVSTLPNLCAHFASPAGSSPVPMASAFATACRRVYDGRPSQPCKAAIQKNCAPRQFNRAEQTPASANPCALLLRPPLLPTAQAPMNLHKALTSPSNSLSKFSSHILVSVMVALKMRAAKHHYINTHRPSRRNLVADASAALFLSSAPNR